MWIVGLVEKVSQGVNSVVERVTVVLAIVLTGVVSLGVIFRYLFNSPLSWEQESSILLFMWVAFLGASIAFYMKSHVRITFVVDAFPGRLKVWVALIGHIALLLFFGIMLGKGMEVVLQTAPHNFQTLPISLGWLYAAAPVSGAIMLLYSLKMVGESLGDLRHSIARGDGGENQ